MKAKVNPLAYGLFLLLAAQPSLAATCYVNLNNPSPMPPYTNWSTAATNIQEAVDAAMPGDTVLVTNGVYANGGRAVYGQMTNRVAVNKPLMLLSINGPAMTVIVGAAASVGQLGDGAIRCAYVGTNAVFCGFTMTNGYTRAAGDIVREQSGGGVWCEVSGVVSNCTLIANQASYYGGGAYSGRLHNCTLATNVALWKGGGASDNVLNDCVLNNCTLTGNTAKNAGGGACYATLNDCTLMGNSAGGDGGGGAAFSTLNNCSIRDNSSTQGGGSSGGTLNSCTISSNSASVGGGAYSGTLNNCTMSRNFATSVGGGALGGTLSHCTLAGNTAGWEGGGGYYASLNNCIVYYNTAPIGPNYSGILIAYSCTTPMQPGSGNITNEPLFLDWRAGNLRLQSNSPCINAGGNAYIHTLEDLDGNQRVKGGTVDIGAYEFQDPTSILSYAWLQQYGLPTDGTADYADPDGDRHNNWQEWRCGTDPTNVLSVLRLLMPSPSLTNVVLTWQSEAGLSYVLDRSTNLQESQTFTRLATNILGQEGTTTYIDTNAPVGSLFYRVGVSPP